MSTRGYEHLLAEDEVWVLEKLLPGQRAGTREWGLFLKETLEEEQYESLALSPTLLAKRLASGQVEGVILVHVDDQQGGSHSPTLFGRIVAARFEQLAAAWTANGRCHAFVAGLCFLWGFGSSMIPSFFFAACPRLFACCLK